MTESTRSILNDPELISLREYHMERLTRLFAGETLDSPFFLAGIGGHSAADPTQEPERWAEESLADLALNLEKNSKKIRAKKTFYAPVVNDWIYGVHFTDSIFGAEPHFQADNWWFTGAKNEIGELPVPDLEHNETWKKAQAMTLALVDAGVKLPFYETQVLGEPWNQTFNLYRERGLIAFLEEPEAMKRDLQVVTDTLVEMHKWYIKTIPADQFQPICTGVRCQPRGFGQMCGCSTHLISNALFEEFIRECDDRILSLYPHGGMYHLCGHHTQHMPSWHDMPRVRAFQVNDLATDLFPEMYRESRPDQIFHLCLTENMPYEKALALTDGGKRCVFCMESPEDNNEQ